MTANEAGQEKEVARAIYDEQTRSDTNRVPWEKAPGRHFIYVLMARAAIAALARPTNEGAGDVVEAARCVVTCFRCRPESLTANIDKLDSALDRMDAQVESGAGEGELRSLLAEARAFIVKHTTPTLPDCRIVPRIDAALARTEGKK